MTEKNALVPRLRFPSFRGEGGWRLANLATACDLQAGKFVYASGISERNGEGLYPCYGGNGFRGYTATYTHDGIFPLIGRQGALCGNVRLVSGRFHATEHAVVATTNEANEIGWLYYALDVLNLNRFATGQAQPGLSVDVLNNVSLAIPPRKTEQQKIAECLSSVDELIAAQARKVDALTTHKKGLMQQLFPREGEVQPRLRFPEFQSDREWREAPLGEVAEIKLGKMLDKQKHRSGHLLPYLNNLAVRWNEVNISDLPSMYFSDRELERFGLRAGDVVVCEGGEPGRAAIWDGRLPDLKFQKAIHRVRFNVPYEPKILVLYLENVAGTTEFEMLFTGGGIKHLTGEAFSRFRIPLIPYAEQQRIASCLSSLDNLITAESQKLELLKRHKRGLMQQLFPTLAEVEV